MRRGFGPRRRILFLALLLPALALIVVAIADFVRIGDTPKPCSRHTAPDTTALVLSGAPNYRRTRHAVALYRQGRVAHIVFSGAGSGGDSAHNLARDARRLGIPATDISIEGRARSTAENFRYACAMPALQGGRRVAIVTDRFHAFRAWTTAEHECSHAQLCSATVAGPVPIARRFSETEKLLAYQVLGRAALW